ncbi:MAG: glycoside hydrolase family protein [Acidithiobacillus sp.]
MNSPPLQLIQQLKLQEGEPGGLPALKAYWDPIGQVWTAGYGQTGQGIGPNTICTPAQADTWLLASVERFTLQLDSRLPWAPQMGVVRHSVFVNMEYNMGLRFQAFTETINDAHLATMAGAAQDADYDACAAAMLDSLWARQVKGRAIALAKQMRTDEWVI